MLAPQLAVAMDANRRISISVALLSRVTRINPHPWNDRTLSGHVRKKLMFVVLNSLQLRFMNDFQA
ncbi:MAG: hypothetical protein ACLR17_01995 [Enterobacteriaceae bacterium]